MLVEQSVRGWRAARYLLLTLATGMAALPLLPLLVLPPVLRQARRWAEWERGRAHAHIGADYAPLPTSPMPERVAERLRYVLRDPGTWRSIRGLAVHALLGTLVGIVGLLAALGVPSALVKVAVWWAVPVPVTFVGIPAHGWGSALIGGLAEVVGYGALFLWGAPAVVGGYARLTARMLSPSDAELRADRLSERVEELSHTRAEALQAHGAELRRIERDLHDGTQARLVALAMRMGIAERMVADDPEQAVRLLREARGNAEGAMAELRDVIRTMYPPILTDRGLNGAVSALGARCTVPTRVRTEELGALPAAVEAAAYFAIAEALTNAAKHAAATSVDVAIARTGATLRIEVTDDGIGGADDTRGTGISGIRRRVAALDGTASVVSPVGGPTVIRVELPCAS